jgi:cytidylate kinase
MAEDEHVQRRLYELTDERNVSFIESLVAPFRTEAPKARDDYFHKLVRAVRTIACQSSVIFLGRGAGFILPNEVGLHVRIVAPFEPCVARHAKQTGLAPDDAAKQVRSTNEARDGFLRQRFGLDPTDPCRYDLLVNTATFAPRDAARVIVAALHAK